MKKLLDILFTYILLTVYVEIEPLQYIPYFIFQPEQYCFNVLSVVSFWKFTCHVNLFKIQNLIIKMITRFTFLTIS